MDKSNSKDIGGLSMALKIIVDNDEYEIIESGSIIVDSSTAFSMTVGDSIEKSLIVTFEFMHDGDETGFSSVKSWDY